MSEFGDGDNNTFFANTSSSFVSLCGSRLRSRSGPTQETNLSSSLLNDNDGGPVDIVGVDNGDCGDLLSDDGDDNDG